jgi:hypothetical protein
LAQAYSFLYPPKAKVPKLKSLFLQETAHTMLDLPGRFNSTPAAICSCIPASFSNKISCGYSGSTGNLTWMIPALRITTSQP